MSSPARDAYEQGLRLTEAGRHAEAIGAFEAALNERPGDIRALFALGNTARALGMPDAAAQFFRQVLAADPARIEALVGLANLLRAQGAFEGARALLEPALARHPEWPELWLTLGSVHREMGDSARAAEHYRGALVRCADYAPALGNLADLLAEEGKNGEALAFYGRALAADPGNAQARLNRAVLHLGRGNLEEGWRDYSARLQIQNKVPVPEHGLPRWDGNSLKDKCLLITAEQGVGDQIMFASVIPELASRAEAENGHVVLECEPRLVSLFARSFPTVTVHAWDIATKAGATHAHYGWLEGAAHTAIEMGSPPGLMRSSLAAFPNPNDYLTPNLSEQVRWQGVFAGLGTAPVIGICWRSGKTGGHRAVQFAPLEAWAEFIRELPGAIVSAQYDAETGEIAALEKLSGRKIFVPPFLDQKNELDRTAAMLASLDAVIAAPTAVSWLAAGLGMPTVKILYDTSWTAFGEAYEPFAPACILAMPDHRGNWADTFGKAREILTKLI